MDINESINIIEASSIKSDKKEVTKIDSDAIRNLRVKIRVLKSDLLNSCLSDGELVDKLELIFLGKTLERKLEEYRAILANGGVYSHVSKSEYINAKIPVAQRMYVIKLINYMQMLVDLHLNTEDTILKLEDSLQISNKDQHSIFETVELVEAWQEKISLVTASSDSDCEDGFEKFLTLLETAGTNVDTPFFITGDKNLDSVLTSYEALKVLLIAPSGNGKTTLLLNILNNTKQRKHLVFSIESTAVRLLDNLVQMRTGYKIDTLRQGGTLGIGEKSKIVEVIEDIKSYITIEESNINTLAGIEGKILKYHRINGCYPDNIYIDHVGLIDDNTGMAGRLTAIFEKLKDISKKYNISTFILAQSKKDYVKDDLEFDKSKKISNLAELRYAFNGFSGMFNCVKPEVSFDVRLDMQSLTNKSLPTYSAITVQKCRNQAWDYGNVMLHRVGMNYHSEPPMKAMEYGEMPNYIKDTL
jgi:replicative DNA helicase